MSKGMTTEVEIVIGIGKNGNDKGWQEFLNVKIVLDWKHKIHCSLRAFFQSTL